MLDVRKVELLNIVSSLQEANVNIRQLVATGNELPVNTMADCQDLAVSLGNYLEEHYPILSGIVNSLEKYCEYLYQLTIASQTDEQSVVLRSIGELLQSIKEQLEKSIPADKKEIVFLPYKASMWDSLETVWESYQKDETVKTYVVPIPYYDKHPDGSIKEWHYEGEQFPKNVPITSWQEYHLEERKPEQIYIHNPYDEYNHVTSVHPDFYSSKINAYTECLTYIPYFVMGEIDPGNKEAVKGMEHFCVLPGVIYAHKVILQSEKMRQIYINVLTETVGEESRERWEKKIFGTGSPKLEKIKNYQVKEEDIPEDWKSILYKEDGSRKKIIFYNTSITALLRHDEAMLIKMKDVFRTFYANRDKVALLWRPHPLIQATIESMRPELWEKYKALVEEYKTAGWGIYDDTPDIDRAIALCDGYYGDNSSVVTMCRSVKKPCMIQNVDVVGIDNNE